MDSTKIKFILLFLTFFTMKALDNRIVKFIEKHHVLTLATCNDNHPWCANCFYAFHKEQNMLIFTSDMETRHVQEVLKNPFVAGSIVLETHVVGKIRGIQFTGYMERPGVELQKEVKRIYLKRFPYAALMKTTLWVVKLKMVKMTDNRLGFGKKLTWEQDV